MTKPKALVKKLQRKSVKLAKPAGGVHAVGQDADPVHTLFCLILKLCGISDESSCFVEGMAFMRRLYGIFAVTQQLVSAATG